MGARSCYYMDKNYPGMAETGKGFQQRVSLSFLKVLQETYCQTLTVANMNSPSNVSIKQTKV